MQCRIGYPATLALPYHGLRDPIPSAGAPLRRVRLTRSQRTDLLSSPFQRNPKLRPALALRSASALQDREGREWASTPPSRCWAGFRRRERAPTVQSGPSFVHVVGPSRTTVRSF